MEVKEYDHLYNFWLVSKKVTPIFPSTYSAILHTLSLISASPWCFKTKAFSNWLGQTWNFIWHNLELFDTLVRLNFFTCTLIIYVSFMNCLFMYVPHLKFLSTIFIDWQSDLYIKNINHSVHMKLWIFF